MTEACATRSSQLLASVTSANLSSSPTAATFALCAGLLHPSALSPPALFPTVAAPNLPGSLEFLLIHLPLQAHLELFLSYFCPKLK